MGVVSWEAVTGEECEGGGEGVIGSGVGLAI